MPSGAKKEEEKVDDEDRVGDDDGDDENANLLTNIRSRKTSFMYQRSATGTEEKRSSLSRAHTVTSRATTEAPLSDTE